MAIYLLSAVLSVTFKIPEFIGLDTEYPLADGQLRRRIHLDGAASPLALRNALNAIGQLLPHYSNTHSTSHTSAKITTEAMNWAYNTVLQALNANKENYAALFMGSGCTQPINRVARGLHAWRGDTKKVVLVSALEHHANDLPHRQFGNKVEFIPLIGESKNQGLLDLNALEELLKKHEGQVNYVSVSAVSNVTGLINPIYDIAKLAHKYDAYILVDAAQMVAHMPVDMSRSEPQEEIDFLVFSGHKVYAPSSPGVLVAKTDLLKHLPEQDFGGGSVSHVSYEEYILLDNYPDREQSGTPNISGAISLATSMKALSDIGMLAVFEHGKKLMQHAIKVLSEVEGLTIYGDVKSERVGALSFNLRGIDHGLVASILSDYFGIAVRNECFCAHPYVSSMLKEELWQLDLDNIPEEEQEAYIKLKRGMVRASFSLYNTIEEIDYLAESLNKISQQIEEYKSFYQAQNDGSYIHTSFKLNWVDYFNPEK